jgi:hypothetical protein
LTKTINNVFIKKDNDSHIWRNKMKVFLDDKRTCPEGFVLAQTATAAIKLLSSREVTHISLDFDLGYRNRISWTWLEEFAESFEIERFNARHFLARGFVDASVKNLDSLNGGSGETVAIWLKYAAAGCLPRVVWRIHSRHGNAQATMSPHLNEAGAWWSRHEAVDQFPSIEY